MLVTDRKNFERSIALNLNFSQEGRLLSACTYDPRTCWEVPYHSLTLDETLGFLLTGLEFAMETIPTKTLVNVMRDFKDNYLTTPRFHNWGHALQVFHSAVLMDHVTPKLSGLMDSVHSLALFIATIAHDVAHRGKNNGFEIASQSELALLYNDISVLENHHASLCGQILKRHDFLQHVPDGKQFRKIVINAILGTDMSKHGDLMKKMQTSQIESDQELVVTCCTHCADLGAQVLPISTAWEFYMRCTDEFQQQALDEKELGLPVTPFMTGQENPKTRAFGQVQFIEFVVMPLWKAVSEVFPTTKMVAEIAKQGASNNGKNNQGTSSEQVLSQDMSIRKATQPISAASAHSSQQLRNDSRANSHNQQVQSEWLKNLNENLEVYKFVAKHGKRKFELTEEELQQIEMEEKRVEEELKQKEKLEREKQKEKQHQRGATVIKKASPPAAGVSSAGESSRGNAGSGTTTGAPSSSPSSSKDSKPKSSK
ncbi:unnamed protein product [Amoebophrya sp. A120]|nr:unnamed protein product [Amoebophrya sp. A120]|eukprot:GSA120T00019642001.1